MRNLKFASVDTVTNKIVEMKIAIINKEKKLIISNQANPQKPIT